MPGVGVGGGMNSRSTKDSVKTASIILQWWLHVIIHLSKSIDYATPRVNQGLWIIMMCQYRFLDYNKYTENVDIGEGYARWTYMRYLCTLVLVLL